MINHLWQRLLKTNIIKFIVFIASIIGLFYCISVINKGDLSNVESNLLSILLTISSVIASAVVTHFYADYSNSKNVEIYATKALEKVDNLTAELGKLASYLNDELEAEKDIADYDLQSKKERIRSAIHILNTLQTVNEKSSSDWKGIIGDEVFNKRRQEEEEKINELNEIVEQYKQVIDMSDLKRDDENDGLKDDIDYIKKKLDMKFSSLGQTPIRSKRKVDISGNCSHCNAKIEYKQRPLQTSFKKIICNQCSKENVARWSTDKGFTLEKMQFVKENISCPMCNGDIELELGNYPGSNVKIRCNYCNNLIEATRRPNTIKLNQVGELVNSKIKIDEEVIESIKEKLPKQPWPKGTSKMLAEKLNIPHGLVSEAIDVLVQRGVFLKQINGVLYEKVEEIVRQ